MYAQINANLYLYNYKYHVKQIDEFMSRFNGNSQAFDSTLTRDKLLISLFDESYYIKNKDLSDKFISSIIANSSKLEFSGENWYAEALCNATYAGKSINLTLELKVERIKDNMFKWVICGAESNVLELSPSKRNPGLIVSPADNEINFMSLSHITKTEHKNILNYTTSYFKPEKLSVFYTLVYNGLVKISNVKALKYHFEIGKYHFTVQYHSRDSYNSGWLISNIEQI